MMENAAFGEPPSRSPLVMVNVTTNFFLNHALDFWHSSKCLLDVCEIFALFVITWIKSFLYIHIKLLLPPTSVGPCPFGISPFLPTTNSL